MDETFSPAVLKGFQSLWLVSSLPNRLKLLEFPVTTKASLFGHRFLQKKGLDRVTHCSFTTLPVSQAATLQILTLQDVPVDDSEKKVKRVLRSTSVASATPRPKTRRPRDSPESPGIVQTCLPGFPSLKAEKNGKESFLFEETSSARKCQSTTSTTW